MACETATESFLNFLSFDFINGRIRGCSEKFNKRWISAFQIFSFDKLLSELDLMLAVEALFLDER